MASNRFRNIATQLDPTMYQYTPQEYLPDLSRLEQTVGKLQGFYDTSKVIPVPQHIQTTEEIQAVKDQYITPMQQLRESAVEAFSAGSISDGIRSLRDMQQKIYEMKQPGGKYNQFEQNYAAYVNYQKELQDRYEKADISSEKRDDLLKLSRAGFSSSFLPTGEFKPFQGITAAKDVALTESALELAKGWKADQIASGNLTRTADGTYMYSTTKKFVRPEEVFQTIGSALADDPEVMAYLRQEAVRKGLSGDKAEEFILTNLSDAAKAAAAKEGFTEVDTQHYRNWALEQDREHEFQKAIQLGEMATGLFSVTTGASPIKMKEGKVLTGVTRRETRGGPGVPGYISTDVYEQQGLDRIVMSNPDFAREHPGVDKVISSVSRYTTNANGTKAVKSDAQYNEEVIKIYNDYIERKKTDYVGFDTWTGEKAEKMREAATSKLIDELPYHSYTLVRPGKPPVVITYEDLVEKMNVEDKKELKEKLSVVGTTRSDSRFYPGSFVVSAQTGNEAYTIIASPEDVKASQYASPFSNLLQPEWDLTLRETEPQVINLPDAEGNQHSMVLKSVNEPVVVNGILQDNLIFYEAVSEADRIGMGDTGLVGYDLDEKTGKWVESKAKIEWQPAGIDREDVIEAESRTNPFSATTPYTSKKR